MDTRGAEQHCLRYFAVAPYEGATHNDRFHGFGVITVTGQHEYAGMFKDGRRHGLGTMSWADGLKYVGPWEKNSATGQGALSWPNGTEYYGDVRKGRRQGYGVQFHNDNMFAGEWHQGRRHGFGLQVSPLVSYSGEWQDGRRNGWGLATFASGNVYCGSWKDDKMHGYGTMSWVTNKDAKTMQQIEAPLESSSHHNSDVSVAAAANREYIRRLRAQLTNVGAVAPGPLGPYTPSCVEHSNMFERYTGTFEDNVPHGLGQYESYFYDGDARDIPFDTINQYNGTFERGMRSGHGVQKYADGTMYSGQWSANMKHGKGAIVHPDGTCDDVVMEHDAPQRNNRPTTARSNLSAANEYNAAIEDSLELNDLFLSKQDRDALKELLTRFKSSLKHLFICYAKLWTPGDLAAKVQCLLREDARVPPPLWESRVDSDIREVVAFGSTPQTRNTEVVVRMTRRAEKAARAAAEKAMSVVAEAAELHQANAKQGRTDDDANDSDNEPDDFINVTAASRTSDSASVKRNRKRPATPLNESGIMRSAAGRPPAPPLAPQRQGRLSHISRSQFLALLRDALVLDAELTNTAVNDVIYRAMQQKHSAGATDGTVETSLFNPADNPSEDMSFRSFVECIVRIADVKFSATSTFAAPTITRKWTIADRLEFLLDHFIEPLRTTLCETELSNELRSMDWPVFLADASGDHTLEDLRRYAYRVVQREQAKAATTTPLPLKVTIRAPGGGKVAGDLDGAAGSGPSFTLDANDGGVEVTTAPPLAVEEFDATVSDRLTFAMCPNSCVEIVTVDVTSTKGSSRSHQLYFLKQNAPDGQLSTFFGGVVPSYHPAVSTVDVYDVLAALPTSFLHLSSALRPAIDRHLRFFLQLFQSCGDAKSRQRANLGLLTSYLQRRGFFDVEKDPRQKENASQTAETSQEAEAADVAPSVTIVAPGDDVVPPSVPTVGVEAFIRVCWEMEFSCFVPVRPEYCCPSVFLERRSLVTSAIYEDPTFKPLLRVSTDLQEAVMIAVKRTEQWDERRRTFLDAPAAQQGLDAPGTLWWLVAGRMDLTFQQLINIVIRLALTLYGTTDAVAALKATIDRLEAAEAAPRNELLKHSDVPPPSVIDGPLPVRRSANPSPAVVDNKKKPPPKK